MMNVIKKNTKFLLLVIISGIIASIFMPSYYASMLSEEMMNEIMMQIGSNDLFNLVIFIQTMSYAVVLGLLGLILSNSVGLWKPIEFNKKSFVTSLYIGLIGGIVIILLDKFVFIPLCPQLSLTKLSLPYMMISYTYGGVIEEVMLRLFLMSLISLILWKVFDRKSEISNKIYFISNIICAFLFALGHIPATIVFFGDLTLVLIVRCFICNGTLGFMFGHLYQKHGIIYAMIAHIFAHIGMQITILLLS